MKHIIYKTLVILIALTIVGCGEEKDKTIAFEKEKKEITDHKIHVTQAQFEQSKMTIGSLEEKLFPIVVSANGMIDVPPENRAVVNATMGGYIKTTPLLIGHKVSKGQVLVTIENPEFVSLQQQYMEVNEQLTYLKAEYNRQITLKAENITSQKKFLKAESDYKTAVARNAGLDRQLRMLNISPSNVRAETIRSVVSIYAPISGSITKVNVTKGSYVSPANAILEIIDNDHIHLELSIFEKDIMKIKKGQKIDFKIPEASIKSYKAKVHLVGTSIDNNRTVKVHGHLENESDNNFLPGMFVEASITTNSTLAMALPESAVVTSDNKKYVIILDQTNEDNYVFKKVEVNIGSTYEGYTVIKDVELFKPREQFLTKGGFELIVDE